MLLKCPDEPAYKYYIVVISKLPSVQTPQNHAQANKIKDLSVMI
jgi:hypothetical protein